MTKAGLDAGAAPPAPRVPVSERKVTSVLFADLVGFTTFSERRDQEEVRELLSRYFDGARRIVSRYGGTIETFIGDAVMAVWGVPAAHEDDAERAVRAGVELVHAVPQIGGEVGEPDLQLRVGIVTGEVAVTLGAEQQGMVAGEAVTASRVQSVARPGQVWVAGGGGVPRAGFPRVAGRAGGGRVGRAGRGRGSSSRWPCGRSPAWPRVLRRPDHHLPHGLAHIDYGAVRWDS